MNEAYHEKTLGFIAFSEDVMLYIHSPNNWNIMSLKYYLYEKKDTKTLFKEKMFNLWVVHQMFLLEL
jgi:hypothetical protein